MKTKTLGKVRKMTWLDFIAQFGTNKHRRQLIKGLERALFQLRICGCRKVQIGGSFVTDKVNPEDVDVAWFAGRVKRDLLKKLAPDIALSVVPCHMRYCFGRVQDAQKKEYGCHFLVAGDAEIGKFLLDGSEFLRHNKRTNEPRDVVEIDLR